MTNFFEIDKKALVNDKKLIILQEILRHNDNANAAESMRYSSVRNWCNDRLAELTEGRETDFGGSFENLIKKLEGRDDPDEKFLVRIKKGKKKTYLMPNIPKIIDYLQRKRQNTFLTPHDQDFQVNQELLRQVIKVRSLDRIDKYHQEIVALHERSEALGQGFSPHEIMKSDYEFLRDATADYYATMLAGIWRLYVSTSIVSKNSKMLEDMDKKTIEKALDLGNSLVFEGIYTLTARANADECFFLLFFTNDTFTGKDLLFQILAHSPLYISRRLLRIHRPSDLLS